MPVGDPTEPLPESTMRILRPIGYGLAALMLGASAGALLLVLVVALGGPDLFEYSTPVIGALALVFFVLLMRRSRRMRQHPVVSAGLEQRRALSILVCGVIAILLAVLFGLLSVRRDSFDAEQVSGAALLGLAGAAAVRGGMRKLRAARGGRQSRA